MREWNLSWPAVSHNCILKLLLSILTVLETKSTPTVGCNMMDDYLLVAREVIEDEPVNYGSFTNRLVSQKNNLAFYWICIHSRSFLLGSFEYVYIINLLLWHIYRLILTKMYGYHCGGSTFFISLSLFFAFLWYCAVVSYSSRIFTIAPYSPSNITKGFSSAISFSSSPNYISKYFLKKPVFFSNCSIWAS